MNLRSKFSENDLNRIKAAVHEAESKISGEIVPVIVSKSGHYTIANYKASVVAGAFAFLLLIIFDRYVPTLAIYDRDPLLIFFTVASTGALAALAAHYIHPLKRLLIEQKHKDNATRQRAENAFLEEEVFNTRQRTGIMIFISFLEHEVIVMADTGISKVVDQREWDKIVINLTDFIRRDKIVEGLEGALTRCGEILLEKGFVKTPDDINELRDDLRIN
jgi:putative membrane protein